MKKRERNREEEKEPDYKGTNGSDCAHPSSLIFFYHQTENKGTGVKGVMEKKRQRT